MDAAILSFGPSKIVDDHLTLLDDASPTGRSSLLYLGQLVVTGSHAKEVASNTWQGLTGASGLSALRTKTLYRCLVECRNWRGKGVIAGGATIGMVVPAEEMALRSSLLPSDSTDTPSSPHLVLSLHIHGPGSL
jgi:hypothetical protein